MLDIDDAIKQSKTKNNISNGGSRCFDFEDTVLVKYEMFLKHAKENDHAREDEELIMQKINEKADLGVNVPRHLKIKRVVEDGFDICYVLQEKCKGINCRNFNKYGVSFEEMISSLKFILNIPFEQYKKLIADGCQLSEMGYEKKNKNLFYDTTTGFWYIDFLYDPKETPFDINNPIKIFQTLNHIIPYPIQLAAKMKHDTKLTPIQQEQKTLLEYAINAKTLCAIKATIPNFDRYEKIFLLDTPEEYKLYLMQKQITDKNLLVLDDEDYKLFNELYQIVLNNIINDIVHNGKKFWEVECNEIRINAKLFNLQKFWQFHKDSSFNPSDYPDKYSLKHAVENSFTTKMLTDIIHQLQLLPPNEFITNFLNDAQEKITKNQKR